MLIISPSKQFVIERHLNNPSDTNTYYCKAVVTNTLTGEVLQTINLTDNGGLYYTGKWVTPGDPSGTGLQVTVSTTIYTDAGYTTVSVVYGTEKDSYIVQFIPGVRGVGVASGYQAEAVDYKKMESTMRKVVGDMVKIPETKMPEQYDDSNVMDLLSTVHDIVSKINIPKDKSDEIVSKITNHPNFANLSKIGDLPERLKSLMVIPKQLESVIKLADKFEQAEKSDDNLHAEIQGFLSDQKDERTAFYKQLKDILTQVMKDVTDFNSKADEIVNRPLNVVFSSRPQGSNQEQKPKIPSERSSAISKLLGH